MTVSKKYKLCIISDACNDQSNNNESIFSTDSALLRRASQDDMPFDVKIVFVSDLMIECMNGRERIFLPNGDCLLNYDAVLPRLTREDKYFVSALLNVVQNADVYCPYGKLGYEATSNKFLALSYVSRLGFETPKSIMVGTQTLPAEHLNALGWPIIGKTPSGFGGEGLIKISVKDEAVAIFEVFKKFCPQILFQEFIATNDEHGRCWDLRLFVIGDHAYAVRRYAAKDDFRSGISTNGVRQEQSISDELMQQALKISAELDMDICGIDFIQKFTGEYVFLEANCTPGMFLSQDGRGYFDGISTDFVTKVLLHVAQRCSERT